MENDYLYLGSSVPLYRAGLLPVFMKGGVKMTDQEKLEKLTELIAEVACGTTYNYPGGRGFAINTKEIAHHLIANGVTVREMQKPLTLEELRRIEEQPVWCETEATRKPCVVKRSLIDKEDAIFYALGSECPIFFSVEDYGQFWRCWAEKPTEEERKAAEWERPT